MLLDSPASTLLRTSASKSPPFLYGTAWKKDTTTSLVRSALAAGFLAIDTAAQPRHYREDLVGHALRDAYKEGIVKREDVFVQTKFTAPQGQDLNNMPYDKDASVGEQVRASVASSFWNLREKEEEGSQEVTGLDCLVLHSPLRTMGETMEAWRVLEGYVPERIKRLGISNTTLPVLKELCERGRVKPAVVQNRFYPATKWDGALRRFCGERGIVYQSFWTLTGNPGLLRSAPVAELVREVGVGKEVALYALVMSLDVAVLNGTTSEARMKEDLEGIRKVDGWARDNERDWLKIRNGFRHAIGEEAVE